MLCFAKVPRSPHLLLLVTGLRGAFLWWISPGVTSMLSDRPFPVESSDVQVEMCGKIIYSAAANRNKADGSNRQPIFAARHR